MFNTIKKWAQQFSPARNPANTTATLFAGGANKKFSIMEILPSVTAPPRRRGKEWLQMYSQHPWLHANISRIAESVCTYSPHLFLTNKDRVEKEELYDHPILDLLNRPNPIMSGLEFRRLNQIYIELRGECFWLIERNAAGMPAQLYPIPPHWVVQVPYCNSGVFHIQLETHYVVIPQEDIVWIKMNDPVDPYLRGVGAAEAVGEEIDADQQAARWNKMFFYNSARPDMAIMTDATLNEDQITTIQQRWVSKYGGVQNSNKPAILTQGTDVKELTRKHLDMEFSELRRTARDNVCGAFGMSIAALGIVESVNRANAEAGEYLFSKWTVEPRLRFWSDELTFRLCPLWDVRLKIDFTSAIPLDRDRRLKESMQGVTIGAVTVNEFRVSLGWDKLPGWDVLLLPSNKIPVQIEKPPEDAGFEKPKPIGKKPEDKPEKESDSNV